MPSLPDLVTPIDQAPPGSGPALFLEFARRGKPGGWRYAVVILAGLVLAIVLGAVLALALAWTGLLGPQGLGALQLSKGAGPSFPIIVVNFAPLLFGFWASSRWVQGKRLGDIVGLWRWSLTAKGAGVWAVVVAVGALADYALHPSDFSLSADSRTLPYALSLAPALALQTFTEEFVFRGVITQGLVRAFKRPAVACLISGLIFGAMHVLNGPFQAATATAFGVILAYMALRTGGLALGWGIHLANNLFAGIVVVSTGDVFTGAPGLIRQRASNLDGFDFAFSVAALLLVTWFLLRRAGPAAAEAQV
jgi:uncharacterized protein